MSKITKITHPSAYELRQARIDESIVTGRTMIERPFYYENTETGQQYYDLYGCIGWPTEVTDKNDMRAGYLAIVGVIKDDRPPQDAVFRLLAEAETKDIPTLLLKMHELRNKYGFGLHPSLLQPWIGDPERFITTIALINEKLKEKNGSDKKAILIAPPLDFYTPDIFEIYSRSFYSVVANRERLRFYYGQKDVLINRIREFKRDDPAILAIGGLVHTLLHTTPWMDQVSQNMFVIPEGV